MQSQTLQLAEKIEQHAQEIFHEIDRVSLYNTQNRLKPTTYDVIACLEWYPIFDFENFCLDFGYDTDSIKAFNIYTECQKQQKELFELIPEEKIREQIREII